MPRRPADAPASRSDDRVRLQKLLAEAGYGSRRACEEFITAGRVAIDGEIVTELGTKVDPHRQEVHVDGERVSVEPKRYFLVNKPIGYLCTNNDPRGRPRVVDLFPPGGPRLYTVGRLDENSRGLLLVTNDGEMANQLLHPRYELPRRYRVQVAGDPSTEVLEQLKAGLHFTEGKFSVQGVKKLRMAGNSTWLELVLTEGKNREIRRLLARVGHKVMKLERIGFGPLRLGNLAPGAYRPLTRSELDELREAARGRTKAGPRRRKQPVPRGEGEGEQSAARKPRGPRKPAATRDRAGKPDRRKQSSGSRNAARKPAKRK